jgi:WD40 repeat protein
MHVPLSGASLQLSPDGRLLAVGDRSDVVLLDASSGTEVRRFRGHSEAVTALRFSDGGALLASGSADRSAMVWDVETGERRERLVGHYGAVAALGFSPDGGALFTTGTDRTVLQWDLGGYSRFIPRVGSAGLPVPSMPIASPDGAIVAYTSPVARPGRAGSAALRFRRIEATWNVASSIGALIDTGHGRWLAAAWRPDLKPPRLATTGDDGVVRVWDPAEQTAVSERRVADGAVTGLDYTSDGRRLLLAEAEGTVRLVDADTLSPTVASVDVGRQVVLAFVSPSGKRAVVLTRQGRFVVVDLVKGTVEHDSPLGFVPTWADFSPDGARIAFAGSRGQLALLDAKTGNWLRRPSLGHKDQTLRVAFAPSGTTFVSGSADGRVSLWDGHTGQRLGTLQPGPSAEGVTADFLEGSPTVLITGVDGTTYRWDTDPASWLKAACDIAGRNLSRQEWRETFGERPYHRTC